MIFAILGRPPESGNNTHFQRHSCTGLDFWSGNGIFGFFYLDGYTPMGYN
jgi:hypothetical protein